jgi:excisionase family DNA binding protein
MEMLLTVEQAAERLQLTAWTVREHLKSGKLRGVKRGSVWRVPEAALLETVTPPASDWAQSAQRLSHVYADSIASGGELTAFATAPGEVYDYDSPTGTGTGTEAGPEGGAVGA